VLTEDLGAKIVMTCQITNPLFNTATILKYLYFSNKYNESIDKRLLLINIFKLQVINKNQLHTFDISVPYEVLWFVPVVERPGLGLVVNRTPVVGKG